ncbi:MAG: HDOD domain-containing protein [Candidatus Brocadia sp.]|nr:HDOD domain-containing protein [Candidatus Brocadia sp.]
MKRILFVDDELKVLQGLQRMLRFMRHEWHMEFATSGQEALEILAKSSFDVIVTDMHMPGMNGTQLLNEVMRRYPSVVRIILSGQTDQDVFLSSSHLIHQFLSKPCDTESLKTTIARSCAMQGLLKDKSLKKLVLQIESLPSLSNLYLEILEVLQSPNVSMEKVGQVISKDLGMTAKILQIVNSAFYGLRRRISNPTEAVVVLGLSTIRALVLSYQLFSSFEHVKLRRFSADILWKHSMIVGAFAKQIARAENYPSKLIDDALIAGMFHDIGKLILAANLLLQYDKMLDLVYEKSIPHWEGEQEIFNGTHAEVGAYLLGLWGLSDSIIEAIAFHHIPAKCPAKTFTLVTAVHIADALGNTVYPMEIEAGSQVDYNYITELGLSERLSVWRESCMGISAKEFIDG